MFSIFNTVVPNIGFEEAVLTFTDTAFSGATISPISNSFPSPFRESLVGDTLTVILPNGGCATCSGTFNAVKKGYPLVTLSAADAAIQKAIELYSITDPHRQRRLVAQPIDSDHA